MKHYDFRQSTWFNVLTYFLLFLFYQVLATLLVTAFMNVFCDGVDVKKQPEFFLASSLLYSIAIMVHFMWKKWCRTDFGYLKSKPWVVLFLAAVASLSSIIPSVWLQELAPDEFTKNILEDTFDALLSSPVGYVVVGLLAPIVEEVVFRGAILRRLLMRKEGEAPLTGRQVRIAIVISAAIFSLIHMNPAQMPHAFIIGILLGWLYYRTGSIIPGVFFHWVNNTMAFVIVALFPDLPSDAKLPDFFNGSETAVLIALGISLVVFIPTLYRLNRCMKR